MLLSAALQSAGVPANFTQNCEGSSAASDLSGTSQSCCRVVSRCARFPVARAAKCRERRHFWFFWTTSLIQFKEDQTCSAPSPDFVSQVINHNIEFLPKGWNDHSFNHEPHALLKQMRASY